MLLWEPLEIWNRLSVDSADEIQCAFQCSVSQGIALFPAYVQVNRIYRKPGYETPVQQDFILHNNCLRKVNRVSEASFAMFLFKRYLDSYLFRNL